MTIFRQRTDRWRFNNTRAAADVDFSTLVLANSPNQYLVCPPDYCPRAEVHREAPVFSMSAKALKKKWMDLMDHQPRMTVGRADDRQMQYDFIQRTALFRFPDTITVRFIPLEDDLSTVAIYSRSKYGYSDWGVNEKRIDRWLDQLENGS